MFKKRLKGLLAMVLAGSIAATALPLTASAVIQSISVDGGNFTANKDKILAGTYTDGPFKSNCTENNLWAYYAASTDSGTCYLGSTPGNSLDSTLSNLESATKFGGDPDKHDVSLRYSHDVVFFDSAPSNSASCVNIVSITDFSKEEHTDVATIAETFGLYNPALQDISGWTAYYGYTDGDGTIFEYNTTGTYYQISANPKITQTIVGNLYNDTSENMQRFFDDGVVIIVPEISDKTFDIPVMNGLGAWEKDANNIIKTIPITNEIGDIDGNINQFYLCYNDGSIKKISDNAVKNKSDLWTYIENLATTIDGFNPSKLYLLRYVLVNVDGDGTDGQFTSKDLFECENSTTTNEALSYMLNAKSKSIWKIVPSEDPNLSFYTYQTGITSQISNYLLENPEECKFSLTEQTSVYVTGEVPTADESISDALCFSSSLLKNGSPATISDHAATLTANKSPEAGKKYDTTGWQLWKGAFTGEVFKFNSQIAVGTGVNSIGIEQLEAAGSYKLIIYFPQVDDTQSGGGNSGGGSSSSREPSYDPDKPMIDGEEKSWSDVAKDIGNLNEGETKTIILGGDKKIPAEVIKAIKDSKAIITFQINSSFSWTVDGSTLTDGDIHDYDFSIEVITATGVEILRGMVGVGFTIGDVTDKATLNINFKTTHSGEFANLYKMVDDELVFVDNVKVDENGAAIGLEVSESGMYVVMLGEFSDRAGDMDNDGILNTKDSLAVIRSFLGIEEGANPLVSDMNGDSYINSKDALIIFRKFLGIE